MIFSNLTLDNIWLIFSSLTLGTKKRKIKFSRNLRRFKSQILFSSYPMWDSEISFISHSQITNPKYQCETWKYRLVATAKSHQIVQNPCRLRIFMNLYEWWVTLSETFLPGLNWINKLNYTYPLNCANVFSQKLWLCWSVLIWKREE